jgi:hypothetical protein
MDKIRVLDKSVIPSRKKHIKNEKEYFTLTIQIPKKVVEELGIDHNSKCRVSYIRNLRERFIRYDFKPMSRKEFIKYDFPLTSIKKEKGMISSDKVAQMRSIDRLKCNIKKSSKYISNHKMHPNVKRMWEEFRNTQKEILSTRKENLHEQRVPVKHNCAKKQ